MNFYGIISHPIETSTSRSGSPPFAMKFFIPVDQLFEAAVTHGRLFSLLEILKQEDTLWKNPKLI